jgi:hypothetical protein
MEATRGRRLLDTSNAAEADRVQANDRWTLPCGRLTLNLVVDKLVSLITVGLAKNDSVEFSFAGQRFGLVVSWSKWEQP